MTSVRPNPGPFGLESSILPPSHCAPKVRMVHRIFYEGSEARIFPQNITFLSLKIALVLANTVDPDEMQHIVAFQLGLHCLPKFPVSKGLNTLIALFRKH